MIPASSGSPPTGVLLAVAAVVFASAWASISLAGASDRVAPIWFANAFVLAFLLKREAGTVEVLGAAFAANVLANVVAGDGLPAGFVLSACNTVELSVALWGLRRDRGPELDLSQARVCLRFGLWGALAGTAVAGLPAAAWLALAQGADPFAVWHRWVAADALGLMVLTPLLVSARRRDLPAWGDWRGLGQAVGVLLLVGALALLVFAQDRYPLQFLTTPVIVFVAFVFGFATAAAGIALTALVAVGMTLTHSGPVALIPDSSTAEHVFLLQLYLATLVVTALPAAASLAGRRRFEAALQDALDRAKTGERVKATFLATMSHEIRTPLTASLGMTELLARQPLDERSRRCAEAIEGSGRQLLAIVDDILDYLRASERRLTLRPVDFSLPGLIEEVRTLFEPMAVDKGLALEMRVAPDALDWLRVDAARLRQILINLVGNGLKFTRSGWVRFDARTGDDGRGGVELHVHVADSGIGVPESQIDRIFDPFSQANATFAREHGGPGLGLAISRELARLMGGEIGCVSGGEGGGSTFWVRVPVAVASPPAAGPSPVPSRPLDILLAEDVLLNQELIVEVIERHGHRVAVVDNGLELLERCATRRFDVLLVDIQMPLMDGEEAIRRLRASDGPNRTTPAIALTANVMEADHERFLRVGMQRTLTKPIAWPTLVTALNGVAGSPGAAGGEPSSQSTPLAAITAASTGAETDSTVDPAPDPAPLGPNDRDLLDQGLIEALRRSLPAGRFDALVARVLREAAAKLPLLASLDEEARCRLAHRLKGTCGSFGLAALARAADALERAAGEDGVAVAIKVYETALWATADILDVDPALQTIPV